MNLVERARAEWQLFRAAPPGRRFREFHERFQRKEPRWMRPLLLGLAAVAFVLGVLLTVLPGPAVAFFAVALALVAADSAVAARALDRAELFLRGKKSSSDPDRDAAL